MKTGNSMRNTIFTEQEWTKALEGLREAYKVIVPVKDGDFHSFKLIDEGKKADFTFRNTRLSPKSLIYPQSERMFEYALENNSPDAMILKEASKEYLPQAIVGIRPCDAHAFQIVRVNFDNREYRDPWWVQRFEATTLVGLGCNEPCSTCFCTSVGGGPFDGEGLDVLLFDLGDSFLARALTEKGETFLEKTGQKSSPNESTLEQAEELAVAAAEKIASEVPTDGLRAKAVKRSLRHLSGKRRLLPASIAAPAPTFAPHAGALISRMRCRERLEIASGTGIPACFPFSPFTPPVTIRERERSSVYVSGLCTN